MRFYRRPAPRVALSPNLATGREVSGLPRSWRRVWVWGEGRRRGHPSSIGDARQKEIVGGRGKNCWNCSKGCFAMAKVIRRVFSRDLMGIPRCKFRLLKNLAVNLTKLRKFLLARLKSYITLFTSVRYQSLQLTINFLDRKTALVWRNFLRSSPHSLIPTYDIKAISTIDKRNSSSSSWENPIHRYQRLDYARKVGQSPRTILSTIRRRLGVPRRFRSCRDLSECLSIRSRFP